MSKVANPVTGSDVAVGDIIIYTLTIANTGTANTQSAYVQDAIPLGTSYIANTTCLNGTLTPGAPVDLRRRQWRDGSGADPRRSAGGRSR